MKLYYAPGACSLSDHMALLEAGFTFELERVDLRTKVTASGADFRTVNPKGYVPALALDNGEVLTENVAILDWIAAGHPELGLTGPLGHARLLEMLAFVAAEVHHAYKPMWGGSDEDQAKAREVLARLYQLIANRLQGDYLFGGHLTVADCYVFVTLRWADAFGVSVPESLVGLRKRIEQRPSFQLASQRETEAAH